MTNFFKVLLEIICWIQIALFPVIIFGILGLILRKITNSDYGTVIIVVSITIGVIFGILLAERVRKKTGCSTLIFRKYFSSDIDDLTTKK